jgi:hypothetical protein
MIKINGATFMILVVFSTLDIIKHVHNRFVSNGIHSVRRESSICKGGVLSAELREI